jgi:hypothetical protein
MCSSIDFLEWLLSGVGIKPFGRVSN